MKPTLSFENASFYDAQESDELSHETVEEALEEMFDSLHDPSKTIYESIEEACPLEVIAYASKTVSPGFGESAVDRMLEDFDENYWCEEYGDPEGGHPAWTDDELRELQQKLYVVMEEYIQRAHVWQCEQVGAFTYSEEEVLVMMKAACPSWFEENKR